MCAHALGLSRYRCRICGYIYDPDRGDASQGISPGVPFEKLPGNFRCPKCGAYATAGGRKPFEECGNERSSSDV